MNKKVIVLIVALIILAIIGVVAYMITSNNNQELANTNETRSNVEASSTNSESEENVLANNTENINNNTNITNDTENTENEGDEEKVANARIKVIVDGNEEIFANLEDNVASREFLEMLPLTLTFEDFNNTEKIANIPSELNVNGLPSGYTPSAGDLAYYAPWGNISVFYKDFRYSNSLYKLGTLESGVDIFGNMNEDFEVTIERVN